MGDLIQIPTVGQPDGPGWRLRPRRHPTPVDAGMEAGASADLEGDGPLLTVLEGGMEIPPPAPYVELHCHSSYSFREGASSPRELVARAAALGYSALAVTDRDGLYGAMEFAREAAAGGVRPIIGADVTLQGGYRLVLLAETREGYANLCRLLSQARLAEAQDGVRPAVPNPQIPLQALAHHARGLIALSGDEQGEVPALVTAGRWERAAAAAARFAEWFGRDSFFIELQQTLTFGELERNRRLLELARQLGLGVVATNDVWYHVRERHRLHDVLVAIRHRTTLDGSHRLRHANSERYLKSAAEMAERFAETPEALRNTVAIAERCHFNLMRDLDYAFPHAAVPPGATPDRHLASICWKALERKYGTRGSVMLWPDRDRYADGVGPSPGRAQRGRVSAAPPHPPAISPSESRSAEKEVLYAQAVERLEEELTLIAKHGLAGFFLAYYDLLKMAGEIAHELKGRDPTLPPDERPVGRGRGSSVSSIVCYLIGLSHIDPVANELFLGRFLNDELPSVPDIDLDFPRDIREEILKRIWTAFDEGRAALVCAYATYHTRSAVRDVAKALGLPAVEIDHLAKLSDAWSADSVAREMERLPEYRAKLDAPLWRDLATLCQEIIGLPRHVTQHVGGMVLSARPLQEFVPLEPTRMEGRVMCQWDKDAVEDARMVKIDFLALGMLSLVDECLDTIEQRHGERPDLGRIPHDDPEIYDRICVGDTIGLFQIESRAQIGTLPHTQPRNLDDLAVQVAIVRPGPIVSGAFHPYMDYRRRLRAGEPVAVDYIHPCLESVLKDTLGVVLYQEQVVQVAMAVASYSAGQADQLRRNLNRRGGAELAEQDWPEFLARARQKHSDISETAVRAAFQSILGFAAYGFPKSHAVAFGLLAYESAWLRYRYPAEYYAALFNNQPMGFYSTEVIAGDARRHGIEVARPDINLSGALCAVETDRRIRLGLAEVKSVGKDAAAAVVAEREAHGPFFSLAELVDRVALSPEALEHLVLAGAFDSTGTTPSPHPLPAGEGTSESTASSSRREADAQVASPSGRGRREAPGEGDTGNAANAARLGEGVPSAHGQTTPQGGRRELLWQLGLLGGRGAQMRQQALPLGIEQDAVALPPMSGWEQTVAEYQTLGLSPEGNAMALLRPVLDGDLVTSAQLADLPDGTKVRVAGLVVCRQQPSTAKGVLFLSLEDEYGIANAVVYPPLFERQRTLILTEPFLIVRGRIQRQGIVIHVIAQRFERPVVPGDRLLRVSHDFH
jgi:error-prone DNA polymerase